MPYRGVANTAGPRVPAIDRLASAGVRFDDAHTHNVTTLPSHANILSGIYPTNHGVRDNSGFRFPATTETLATLLKRHGYRTGAFVSAFPLASRFGLGRGFDVYDDSFIDAQGTRHTWVQAERTYSPSPNMLGPCWYLAQPGCIISPSWYHRAWPWRTGCDILARRAHRCKTPSIIGVASRSM